MPQSLGVIETLTREDTKTMRTELVCGIQQENATEELKHNHNTQRIAPGTHLKFLSFVCYRKDKVKKKKIVTYVIRTPSSRTYSVEFFNKVCTGIFYFIC